MKIGILSLRKKIKKQLISGRIVDKITFKKISRRDQELPEYEIFIPSSRIFFVVNFILREDLLQKCSPTKIKFIIENTFLIKSFYNYIMVICQSF